MSCKPLCVSKEISVFSVALCPLFHLSLENISGPLGVAESERVPLLSELRRRGIGEDPPLPRRYRLSCGQG